MADPTTQPITHAHAYVQYYPGVTIFSGIQTALLEWTPQSRIRLTRVDPSTFHPIAVLLDVALTAIEKVVSSGSSLMLIVGGKRYRCNFVAYDSTVLAAGGVVGLAVLNQRSKKSGLRQWIDAFRAAGVTTRFTSFGTSVLVGIVVAIVIIAVVVVLVLALGGE